MSGETFLHRKDTNLQKSEPVSKAVEKRDRLNRFAREELLETEPDKDSEEVKTGLEELKKTPNTPEARVGAYLKRLERIFLDQSKLFSGTEHEESKATRNLELLKPYIYEEFTLKEEDLPDRHFELQRQIAREQGRDYPEIISKEQRHEVFEKISQDQKHSLDFWMNYLTGPDALYPTWFKFFAIKSILGLSEFDKKEHKFPKRTKSTTGLFPDLNAEALAYVCEFLEKQIQKIPLENPIPKPDNPHAEEQKPVTDEEFQSIITSENFGKYYAFTLEHMTSQKELWPETRGEWRTFTKGEDAELVKSLQGKGTGWCTAGAGMAENQLSRGEFHVYYSLDKLGQPTIPRLAIRMEDEEIVEVRGVDQNQNTDPYILPVLEEKLPEFGAQGEKYLKTAADTELLTQIDQRITAREELTTQDLRFLYEVDDSISTFRQFGADPRIKELLQDRDWMTDMQTIFNTVSPTEVAQALQAKNKSAFLLRNIEKFTKLPTDIALSFITTGAASAIIRNWDVFEDLNQPEIIDALILNNRSAELIFNLERFDCVPQEEIAHKIIDKGAGRYIAQNLDQFTEVDQHIIYQELLKRNLHSTIADNAEKFDNLDLNKIAYELIENGSIKDVLDNYHNFKNFDDQFVAECAVPGNLSHLAKNLRKFKRIEGEAVLDKLISQNFGDAVAENIEVFVDANKQDVVDRLIEKKQIFGILAKLGSYSDIQLDMDVIGDIYLEQLLSNTIAPIYLKEFPLETQRNYADTLVREGKTKQITDSIKYIDNSLHKEISLNIANKLDEESEQNPRRKLDYLAIFGKYSEFREIETSVAFKILSLDRYKSVVSNLEKYPDLDHQELADRIGPSKMWYALANAKLFGLSQETFELLMTTPADDSEGRGVNFHYLFQCIDSFIITDHLKIAEKLIALDQREQLANNLDKLKDLPFTIANNLLPDYGHKIIKNFDAFLPLDKLKIADRLLEEGYAAAVAKNLSELKDINHQQIVIRLIKNGNASEIAKNYSGYGALNLNHQEIAQTLIENGKTRYVRSLLPYLDGLSEEILEKVNLSEQED